MSRSTTRLGMLLAALAFGAMQSPAGADTIIRKKVTYFWVGGLTAADLDRQLLEHGPMSVTTGHRHPGITQITFSGTATYVKKSGRCSIGGAEVKLSTHTILPRWSNRRKASPALRLIWDTLSADIKRHEARHAEIARYHARQMEKRILELQPKSSCEALKAEVTEVSNDEVEAHTKDQQRFDRIEAANFEARLIRLLKYRIATKTTQ